jgi:hypothetical protein
MTSQPAKRCGHSHSPGCASSPPHRSTSCSGNELGHIDDARDLDSDILLIDTTQQSPRMWDQFWAIEMHGLGMIKSLRPAKDGGMRLVSVNPDFRDELAYDGEMNVIGRVVAIVRKV